MHVTCDGRYVAGGVEKLDIAEHLGIIESPVVDQGIGPSLLVPCQEMHVPGEIEKLRLLVIGAGVGGQHILSPPGMRACTKYGHRSLCVEVQVVRLDKHRVGVHVDIPVETESLRLGVITAHVTLDDLAVLVPERTAVTEHGHTVTGVVVQIHGAQGIPVLVLKLDQGSPELSQAGADVIIQIITRQDGLVLEDTDMTDGLDDIGIDIPQGCVADQFGGVVLEAGVPDGFPETMAVNILLKQLLAPEKPDKAVFSILELGLGGQREKEKKD